MINGIETSLKIQANKEKSRIKLIEAWFKMKARMKAKL